MDVKNELNNSVNTCYIQFHEFHIIFNEFRGSNLGMMGTG